MSVARRLRDGYTTGTRRVHDGYTTGTRRLHGAYTTATRRLHAGYTAGFTAGSTAGSTVSTVSAVSTLRRPWRCSLCPSPSSPSSSCSPCMLTTSRRRRVAYHTKVSRTTRAGGRCCSGWASCYSPAVPPQCCRCAAPSLRRHGTSYAPRHTTTRHAAAWQEFAAVAGFLGCLGIVSSQLLPPMIHMSLCTLPAAKQGAVAARVQRQPRRSTHGRLASTLAPPSACDGSRRPSAVTCGYMRLHAVTCGYMRSIAVTLTGVNDPVAGHGGEICRYRWVVFDGLLAAMGAFSFVYFTALTGLKLLH